VVGQPFGHLAPATVFNTNKKDSGCHFFFLAEKPALQMTRLSGGPVLNENNYCFSAIQSLSLETGLFV
jgi:hypothetical protein